MSARRTTEHAAEPQRLQKLMAAAGLTSRREAESWIEDGRVKLNRRPAKIGDSAKEGDELQVDERRFKVTEHSDDETEVLIYNKPEGEVTSRADTEGRRTVFDRLPEPKTGRWVAVGRLDINTSGLLLLTNDGELANKLMHPSSNIDREYACRVHGIASDEQLQTLRDGVTLDDGPAKFTDIVPGEITGTNQWFHVALMEGRNREVRRLWQTQGLEVSRLKRVRYGAVFMPKGLKRGHFEPMKLGDIRVMRQDIGMPAIPPGRLVLEAIDAPKPSRAPRRGKPGQSPRADRRPGKPGQKRSDSSARSGSPRRGEAKSARYKTAGEQPRKARQDNRPDGERAGNARPQGKPAPRRAGNSGDQRSAGNKGRKPNPWAKTARKSGRRSDS
jgi:23S rRNA pseudouridine2605 synthase